MSRSALLALALAVAVAAAAAAFQPKPTNQLIAAFHSDGFAVVQNATFNSSRGFVLQSLNTTLLSTGAHKLMYYVEGSSYEMGYLAGMMEEEAVGAMTNTYVNHFLISLISVQLDQKCGARGCPRAVLV